LFHERVSAHRRAEPWQTRLLGLWVSTAGNPGIPRGPIDIFEPLPVGDQRAAHDKPAATDALLLGPTDPLGNDPAAGRASPAMGPARRGAGASPVSCS
jgi:hypothetical protein